MLKEVWGRCVRVFNRRFRRRNHVFRHEPGPGPACPGLDLSRYDRPEQVPDHVAAAVIAWTGAASWAWTLLELQEGAALWIGWLDGTVVGAWMSRPGALFRAWFVPLNSADLVLFRGSTAPAFRGRGVSPAMMSEIVARALPPEGRAYVDVSVHNAPSIRAIEKAGFRRIATMKPLSRKQAYA